MQGEFIEFVIDNLSIHAAAYRQYFHSGTLKYSYEKKLILEEKLHRAEKNYPCGLVKFVPAVQQLFYLALPGLLRYVLQRIILLSLQPT